ncbi:hypothetical protein Q7P37_009925 [Cladosporium fusiforme]
MTTLIDLPPELMLNIMVNITERPDLAACRRICRYTRDTLQSHCKSLRHSLSDNDISKPEVFRVWMREASRKDEDVMEHGFNLFHDYYDPGTSLSPDKRNARRVLLYIQEYIGNDRFESLFRALVQESSQWAQEIVSVFFPEDLTSALRLNEVALQILKTSGRVSEEAPGRPSLEQEINIWSIERLEFVEEVSYSAAADFAWSVLNEAYADRARWGDDIIRVWRQKCSKYPLPYSHGFTREAYGPE